METSYSKLMNRLPIYIFICSQWTAMCFDKFGAPLVSSSNKPTRLNETASIGDFPSIINRYHPQPKNLKEKRLLRRMRRYFDEDWMAITRPEQTSDSWKAEFESYNESFAETYKQARNMLSRNDNLKIKSNLEVEALAKFLAGVSTCKVRYEWSDLGELFWPRFIKSGLCTSSESCSWPSGMTCVPGRLKAITILRWRCKRRRGGKRRRNTRAQKRHQSAKGDKLSCSWKLIPYHVPVDCACSC